MRGRSFGAYIIIDESQGLTQFQLKSIISRVGADLKNGTKGTSRRSITNTSRL